jgi:hypothetical protein
MSCFKEKEKEVSIVKLKEMAKESDFILDDTSSNGIYKFIKKKAEEDTSAQEDNSKISEEKLTQESQ